MTETSIEISTETSIEISTKVSTEISVETDTEIMAETIMQIETGAEGFKTEILTETTAEEDQEISVELATTTTTTIETSTETMMDITARITDIRNFRGNYGNYNVNMDYNHSGWNMDQAPRNITRRPPSKVPFREDEHYYSTWNGTRNSDNRREQGEIYEGRHFQEIQETDRNENAAT